MGNIKTISFEKTFIRNEKSLRSKLFRVVNIFATDYK